MHGGLEVEVGARHHRLQAVRVQVLRQQALKDVSNGTCPCSGISPDLACCSCYITHHKHTYTVAPSHLTRMQ